MTHQMEQYAEAAQLLINPRAAAAFTRPEAAEVLQYMHPFVVPAGELFIEEGKDDHTDYALLIVRGVVVVESRKNEVTGEEPLLLEVLEPGRWVGEVALLDCMPRQANCRAGSDENLLCGVLTRASYLRMLQERPRLAAKLSMLLVANMTGVLRAVHQKMIRFIEINQAHQIQQVADWLQQHTQAELEQSMMAQSAVAADGNGAAGMGTATTWDEQPTQLQEPDEADTQALPDESREQGESSASDVPNAEALCTRSTTDGTSDENACPQEAVVSTTTAHVVADTDHTEYEAAAHTYVTKQAI